jgi:hypothetical protein
MLFSLRGHRFGEPLYCAEAAPEISSVRAKLSIAVCFSLLAVSLPVRSHHSFSSEFDIGRPIDVTGTVSRVQWTNPHAWIHIDVEDDRGNVNGWAIELLGINTLVRRGLTRESIRPGDRLSVEGYGARDGTNTANASVVTRAATGEVLWATAAGDRTD